MEIEKRKERRSLINFFSWLQEKDFIDDSKYMVVPYEVVDTYLELNESLIVGQNPIKVMDDDGELIGVRFDKPDSELIKLRKDLIDFANYTFGMYKPHINNVIIDKFIKVKKRTK